MKPIRIDSIEYEVEEKDAPIVLNGQQCGGMITFSESHIDISSTMSPGMKYVTLWHEILHGMIFHRGLEMSDKMEEKICSALSRGIAQILKDNPHLMEFEEIFQGGSKDGIDIGA